MTAIDGLSALDILTKYRPDFIFIDNVMPNIDGGTPMQNLENEPGPKRYLHRHPVRHCG